MTYQLKVRDVEKSCIEMIKIEENQKHCNVFVQAVARDLMIFLPGASGNANWQVDFMDFIGELPQLFYKVGRGQEAESGALDYARRGQFVVCGVNSSDLNKNPTRAKHKTTHGHVAVVMADRGGTGWLLAYWGQENGTPGRRESLSKCFRAGDRKMINYYAYLL
jgi:hypothetical protein